MNSDKSDTTMDHDTIATNEDLPISAFSVAVDFLNNVMSRTAQFTEQSLKKQSSEVIKRLVDAMFSMFPDAVMIKGASLTDKQLVLGYKQEFQKFWLAHTLKLLQSQSIILRLCGWEQVQDVVNTAIMTRPHAAAYLVCNAGLNVINGIYEINVTGMNQSDADTSPKYENKWETGSLCPFCRRS